MASRYTGHRATAKAAVRLSYADRQIVTGLGTRASARCASGMLMSLPNAQGEDHALQMGAPGREALGPTDSRMRAFEYR